MAETAEPSTILIKPEALKQMIAWDLLCLGILERKDQEFEITMSSDGVMVRTEKR